MRLSDFLQGLHQVVAYYPALVPVCGSVNATILLCQFVYWQATEGDSEGWLAASREVIQRQTGLSRDEQAGSRRLLRQRGLLVEQVRGMPATMHYHVRLDALNKAWDAANILCAQTVAANLLEENPPTSWRKTRQLVGGKPANSLYKEP